jgi:hypothetical protein
MNQIKILFVLTLLITFSAPAFAQIATEPVARERLFTDKDRDFLQLWYHEQMQQMDMDEEGRYDYLALLNYHTYKMGQLTHPKNNYTDSEQKELFDLQVEKLSAEMKDFLSKEDYEIHQANFGRIVELIYNKKGWERD